MRPAPPFLAAMLAVALAASAPAATSVARNGLTVSGAADGFEVFPRGGVGGADMFCAAGDFARSRLGARATERVEIVRPIGPSATRDGLRSVVFAVRPPGSGTNRGFDRAILRPGSVGLSRSVALSVALCDVVTRFRADN